MTRILKIIIAKTVIRRIIVILYMRIFLLQCMNMR